MSWLRTISVLLTIWTIIMAPTVSWVVVRWAKRRWP